MRIRWFGTAWPSEELPAAICGAAYRIDAPLGEVCVGYDCGEPIREGERGVVSGAPPDMPGQFWLKLPEPDGQMIRWSACAEHIDCHLLSILGPELAPLVAPPRVPA